MRARDEIKEVFDAGERNGVLDAVAPELILEVLLDVRDLLEGIDARVDDLQER